MAHYVVRVLCGVSCVNGLLITLIIMLMFSKWRTTPVVEEVSVEVLALAAGAAVVVVAEAEGEGEEPGEARPRIRRCGFLHHFITLYIFFLKTKHQNQEGITCLTTFYLALF